jgi:hypothetical protein
MGRVAVGHVDHCANLQPSKECMETGSAGHEAPLTLVTLGGTEPSEKQEEVADPYALIGEVRLRRTDLTERRPPPWPATTTHWIEVGVEVNQCACIMLPMR